MCVMDHKTLVLTGKKNCTSPHPFQLHFRCEGASPRIGTARAQPKRRFATTFTNVQWHMHEDGTAHLQIDFDIINPLLFWDLLPLDHHPSLSLGHRWMCK